MTTYRVGRDRAPTPGMIATAGPGDTVVVYRSAAERHDWAPLAQATMTAFVRGARLRTVRNTEGNPRDNSPHTPAVPESDEPQVSGGAS